MCWSRSWYLICFCPSLWVFLSVVSLLDLFKCIHCGVPWKWWLVLYIITIFFDRNDEQNHHMRDCVQSTNKPRVRSMIESVVFLVMDECRIGIFSKECVHVHFKYICLTRCRGLIITSWNHPIANAFTPNYFKPRPPIA